VAAIFVALLFIRKPWSQFIQLLLALAMLATLCFAGHAGASIGRGHWIHLVDDAFHLIAAGVWPAGLASFAVFLSVALQAKQPEEIRVGALVTQRFSFISVMTVTALVISGAVNAYFLVGTFNGLVATTYGHLLVIKLGIFIATVTVGAINLFWLKPRIVVAAASAAITNSLNLIRSLRRNVLLELSLGAILMIVVGALGVTPPAAHSDMPDGSNIQRHDDGVLVGDRTKTERSVQVAATTR
jgi:putative copper resistance protein D